MSKLPYDVRTLILKAAFNEFCEKRFDRVSVLSITERAQVTRSSFYYYYESKQELYQEINRELKEKLLESVDPNESTSLSDYLWSVTEKILSCKGTKAENYIANMFENMRTNDTLLFDVVNCVLSNRRSEDPLLGHFYKHMPMMPDFVYSYLKLSCASLIVKTTVDYFRDKLSKEKVKDCFMICAQNLESGFYREIKR